ncbi:tRNA pseudouridine synthase B [Phaeosphaeriaceae sp. PMI808]|nr:tRNA pseudouridine synthase B [Phaeosphaeriaceae sp. PMI808]
MDEESEIVLEGVFAVDKPAHISSADVLQNLQDAFATSKTFAPLLKSQPKRPSKCDEQTLKIGHGGTLDPMARGVLIIGIGRGTKHLHKYLSCTKSYDTTISFGSSTDTYDSTGTVTERGGTHHITKDLIESKLPQFRGTITQAPPLYSALKINGIKACEYARTGKPLPRALEPREMLVEECSLLFWTPNTPPTVSIRLTVSSGFYVRSFAHDLGVACSSPSHMTHLTRHRQADFCLSATTPCAPRVIPVSDFERGEDVWGPDVRAQLRAWVEANPRVTGHVDGRKMSEESVPRQRFRGGWLAETKKERIAQQGGKYKGKWGRKKKDGEEGVEVVV